MSRLNQKHWIGIYIEKSNRISFKAKTHILKSIEPLNSDWFASNEF